MGTRPVASDRLRARSVRDAGAVPDHGGVGQPRCAVRELVGTRNLDTQRDQLPDRKSTRLNSRSLMRTSYAVFCLKKTTRRTTYHYLITQQTPPPKHTT